MAGATRRHTDRGFTMLEVMIAIVVLTIGVLSLAGVLAAGLAYMNMSQDDFIAQQKAAEAIESIFTARDTQALSWPQILNVSDNGIFLNGPQPLLDPGPDGIVGTADDDATKPDSIVSPGPDGLMGTPDDQSAPLSNFTRTIEITQRVGGNPNLRRITVIVDYQVGRFRRQYRLVTYISAFS